MTNKQARFSDKVVVITGGTTGIGFATAKRFIAEGARVVVTGKNPDTLARARAELGAHAEVVASDATSVAAIGQLFDDIGQRHGRVDVLFVNAGGGGFRPVEHIDEAFVDELLDLNFKSAYFTVQKALPLLREGASIVLNTSVAGAKGFPTTSVYAAAKAAVRQLARSLGAELVGRGIRVNAVSPGPIETPIYGKLGLGEHLGGFKQSMIDGNPMRRFGSPDEVAGAVLYLASPEASYVTGVELAVDGGITSF
jgi:NAD(P)-dependent dehydrogenase (short-subunit alcohol dehydrogenase family)